MKSGTFLQVMSLESLLNGAEYNKLENKKKNKNNGDAVLVVSEFTRFL